MDLKLWLPVIQVIALVTVSFAIYGFADVAIRIVRGGTRVGEEPETSTPQRKKPARRAEGYDIIGNVDLRPLQRAAKKRNQREAMRAVGKVLRSQRRSSHRETL